MWLHMGEDIIHEVGHQFVALANDHVAISNDNPLIEISSEGYVRYGRKAVCAIYDEF